MVGYGILFMLKIPVMIYRNDECLMNCNSVFNLRTKKSGFPGMHVYNSVCYKHLSFTWCIICTGMQSFIRTMLLALEKVVVKWPNCAKCQQLIQTDPLLCPPVLPH